MPPLFLVFFFFFFFFLFHVQFLFLAIFCVLLLSSERFHNCHYFLLRQKNRPVGYKNEQIEWLSWS